MTDHKTTDQISVSIQAAPTADTPDVRAFTWTRGRIMERVLLGLTALGVTVFGTAWVLHSTTAGTQGLGAERLDAIASWHRIQNTPSAPGAVSDGALQAQLRAGQNKAPSMVVLGRAATHDALERSFAPGQLQATQPTSVLRLATLALGATTPAKTSLNLTRKRLFGSEQSPVDQLIANGWDGIVFDVRTRQRDDLAAIAIKLSKVADYARRLNPGVIIAVSGNEEVLAFDSVLQDIDAVVETALLPSPARRHIQQRDTRPHRSALETADAVAKRHFLDRAKRAGRRIFVTASATSLNEQRELTRALEGLGYVPSISINPITTGSINR